MQPKKPVPAVRPDATARPIPVKRASDFAREEQAADSTFRHNRTMMHWPWPSPAETTPLSDVEMEDERVGGAARNLGRLRGEKQGRIRDREHWLRLMIEGYQDPEQAIDDQLINALNKLGVGAGRTETEARASLKKR